MLDAILFELEGVLVDTRGARRGAALGALAMDGVEIEPQQYDAAAQGLPLRGAIAAALAARGATRDATMLDLLVREAERRFAESLAHGTTLTEGAASFVHAAAGRTRLGIVTRASRREADVLLSLSGLADAFECVLVDEDAYPPKPSGAPYLGALERLARRRPALPRRVLALEDGRAGIRAARTAGVRCAAVGAVPPHDAMEADLLLPSLAEHSLASLITLLAADGVSPR